jgi:hypothetical protein
MNPAMVVVPMVQQFLMLSGPPYRAGFFSPPALGVAASGSPSYDFATKEPTTPIVPVDILMGLH